MIICQLHLGWYSDPEGFSLPSTKDYLGKGNVASKIHPKLLNGEARKPIEL